MDYFQYNMEKLQGYMHQLICFKPYYKWITFNIDGATPKSGYMVSVLNLIINGLLSISIKKGTHIFNITKSFKPYYKWITFNITLFPPLLYSKI